MRGIVGQELILEEVFALGKAIATYCAKKYPEINNLYIARDGRRDSSFIEQELTRSFLECGFDVLSLGLCPTPVLYFALAQTTSIGIMITASHNGSAYNGIKLCVSSKPIWGHDIQEIKDIYLEKKVTKKNRAATYQVYSYIPDYIAWLCEHFAHLKNISLDVVVDCNHGATAVLLPVLKQTMGWTNIALIHDTVKDDFGNREPDPTQSDNGEILRKTVQKAGSVAGMGLDGDGDRLAAITPQGKLLVGDMLLLLYAQAILLEQRESPFSIIFDSKCSSLVPRMLETWGIHGHMAPCGRPFVYEELVKRTALLGGELSCHFFFADRYFGYDDGIYSLLRLLEILVTTNKDLDQLIDQFPTLYSTPELRIPCGELDREIIIQKASHHFSSYAYARLTTFDGIRVELPYGWGILRASHTESVISFRGESATQEGLDTLKRDFYTILKNYCPTATLYGLCEPGFDTESSKL
jgi:phosphomannomutase/phosphoglucomutase